MNGNCHQWHRNDTCGESWGGVSIKDRVPRQSVKCFEKLTRIKTEKRPGGYLEGIRWGKQLPRLGGNGA